MRKSFKFNSKEFSFTLILPIIMSILYIFFQDYKEQLALNRNNFSFWQIYTKDFINYDFQHYFSNTVIILLCLTILFLLLQQIKREELARYYLLRVVLITPWITLIAYWYSIKMGSNAGYFLGSSGIAFSLIGLIIFLLCFLKEIPLRRRITGIVLLLFLLWMAFANNKTNVNIFAHIGGTLIGFVIGRLTYYRLKNK
ncbi:rhomboid family intramembrane serine protease [Candidatus Woesearchaeota archaeon]|nr:rhomboid family intramembrane serine protease [Candidatus Woesearchaeota archaeon]